MGFIIKLPPKLCTGATCLFKLVTKSKTKDAIWKAFMTCTVFLQLKRGKLTLRTSYSMYKEYKDTLLLIIVLAVYFRRNISTKMIIFGLPSLACNICILYKRIFFPFYFNIMLSQAEKKLTFINVKFNNVLRGWYVNPQLNFLMLNIFNSEYLLLSCRNQG